MPTDERRSRNLVTARARAVARTSAIALASAAVITAACTKPRTAADAGSPYRLRFDQLGYTADAERVAVVVSPGLAPPHLRFVDAATNRDVGEATAGPRVLDTTSRAGTRLVGDRVDLGSLGAGRYFVVFDDGSRAGPITIGPTVHLAVLPLVTQFLAEQRCGPTDAKTSIHGACHLFASTRGAHSGDGIPVDDNAKPPYAAAPPIDVEGGWHDAGDYIKFTGTTAFMLATELMALRDHRAALGPGGEDLAKELRWGLDWLVKMLAGAEPFHQVAGPGDHDPDWRLPESDTQHPLEAYDQRPVFRMGKGKGRNILGRAAAAFAFASQVYASDAPYAKRLLDAAKKTYALAKARPGIQNPVPADFYEETAAEDDLVLGAAALARITNDASYARDAYDFGMRLARDPGTPVSWNAVDAIALLEAARAFPAGARERVELAQKLDAFAAPIVSTAQQGKGPGAAFGYALPKLGDGSIAESLGAAAACLAARRLSGTAGCDVVARRQLHWMLGANPFGVAFLTGAGASSPKHVHHSFGLSAHVTVPGAIPGGPTSLATLIEAKLPPPPKDDPYSAYSTDDLLYEDRADNFVCNEPAIDFTAPLVFTLAELTEPPETAVR